MRTVSVLLLLAAVAAAQDKPAFLGVGVDPLDAELRQHAQVGPDVEGLVITALVTPSAASRAGLRLGDVLVSFDGKAIASRIGLVETIRSHKPGDKVAYEVRRGSGTIRGTLRLGVEEEGARMTHLGGEVEPPPPPTQAEADATAPKAGGDVGRRLDKVQKEIEELRERALARRGRAQAQKKKRTPDGLEGWIHREELGLAEARKRGAERRVAFHEARLALLREMRGAEVRLPTERIDRLEKKVDEILALLRRKEK